MSSQTLLSHHVQPSCWGFRSSAVWYYVVGWVPHSSLRQYSPFFFRVRLFKNSSLTAWLWVWKYYIPLKWQYKIFSHKSALMKFLKPAILWIGLIVLDHTVWGLIHDWHLILKIIFWLYTKYFENQQTSFLQYLVALVLVLLLLLQYCTCEGPFTCTFSYPYFVLWRAGISSGKGVAQSAVHVECCEQWLHLWVLILQKWGH